MASGESSNFVMDVMLRAFESKEDVDVNGEITGYSKLLQGLPKQVYVDRGAGNKAKETLRMLDKLGIKRITGANVRSKSGVLTTISNKRGRGMVEKLIGDFKRDFETGLWHEKLGGTLPPDITLGFLNERLRAWCIERNTSPHPKFKSANRWELFADILNTAEFPPEDARSYGTGQNTCTVIQRLIRPQDGKYYVAPSWANDGDQVETVCRNKKCFVYHKNELFEVQPQTVIRAQMDEEFVESDLYEGVELRARFNDELKFFSGGEIVIAKLARDLEDDKREFLGKGRTPDEIRSKARYFVTAMGNKKIIKMEIEQ